MRLKKLLTELGWISDTENYLLMKTSYPEVYLTRLEKKDGFGGIEKNAGKYKFKFNGKVYDNFDDLLKNSKVKRLMRKTYKELDNRIKKIKSNLKYADHGAYGQSKREIENLKTAQQRLKRYI